MAGRHTHKFHLVDPSPWPLLASMAALFITIGGVLYLHYYYVGPKLLLGGIALLICILACWWRDVIREGTFLSHHTPVVIKSLKYGMILFIVSEVMFFFGFFWAFFHSALAPTVALGCMWPPAGIVPFNPFEIPLLNTLILLTSGSTITVVHYAILLSERKTAIQYFLITIGLALLFTGVQLYEYFESQFSINDSVYGSTFFMTTGFHGIHVMIGTIFIIVCFFRFVAHHFTPTDHFGFTAAAWYWHSVDVVRLFLYVFVYFWGNLS